MKLYHGTNTDFDRIDLRKGRPHKDFGQGFYLTDIRRQAVEMAKRRAQIDGGVPIVQTYSFDENALSNNSLSVKIFGKVSEEWALFIIENRMRRNNAKHNYDIVVGPVADDGVVVQIDRYLDRMIDMPTLVRELTYRKLNRQYFFGTERSLKYLTRI